MKKIVPDIYLAILLLLSIIFHFSFPIKNIVHFPYNLVGILLVVGGIIMAVWANYLLMKNNTSIRPYEKPSFLVTTGPFKLSRNPIYLGMAFILGGADIFLGSLITFVFPIFFVLVMKQIIYSEEKDLEAHFGGKYSEYKKKVRRWI